jgi:translation initiation factor 6
VLKVELFRVTVNDGSKFVRSGLLANDWGVVVGSRTKGPELMLLSAAFNR